jgi:hypothetical protein
MRLPFSIVAVVAVSQMGATDCGQVIKDPGFDLWCGDHLCDWKIEKGDAVRVPTWHAGDDGVEMIGTDVLISQQTPVTSSDSTCIAFSMLTDVDLDANVKLQFDVFGDGTIDYEQQIPAATWAPVEYLVRIPGSWNGIELRLSKQGAGHAVLAEIKAETRQASECASLTPIALPPRINGSWCDAAADCTSGACDASFDSLDANKTCGACATDADCAPGSVCGTDDGVAAWMSPFRACVPKNSRTLGEICAEDAECATGVCNQTCSTCKSDAACTPGEKCAAADQAFPAPMGNMYYSMPTFECAPGAHSRASGQTCFRDDDCASAHCAGTAIDACIDVFGGGDGRACASDLDCPENGALDHTPCVAVGLAGGTCQ